MSVAPTYSLRHFEKVTAVPAPVMVPDLLEHIGSTIIGPLQSGVDSLNEYFEQNLAALDRLIDLEPQARPESDFHCTWDIEEIVEWATKLESVLFGGYPPVDILESWEASFSYANATLEKFRASGQDPVYNRQDITDFEAKLGMAEMDFKIWESMLWDIFDNYENTRKSLNTFIEGYYLDSFTHDSINQEDSTDRQIVNFIVKEAGRLHDMMEKFQDHNIIFINAVREALEFIEQSGQPSPVEPSAGQSDKNNAGPSSDPAP